MHIGSCRYLSSFLIATHLLALALVALPATHAAAFTLTYTVNSTADPATGNVLACAPANPGTCTLRDAVAAASSAVTTDPTIDATITFATLPSITLVTPLVINSPVTIAGKGTAVTAISASSRSNDVFDVTAGGPVTFTGVTITSGNYGINITGTGAVTVIACSLSLHAGAGLNHTAVGTVTVTDSSLSLNGRGIVNLAGTMQVTGSAISQNTNTSTALGGGGILNAATLRVTNSTIAQNSAQNGGGIYNYLGIMTVTNSTLSGNTASGGGGGIDNDVGTLTVTNSTLAGNAATNAGGGIFNTFLLTVTNSTLAGNAAPSGGGIVNQARAYVTNTLLVDSASGGDIGGSLDTDSHNITGAFTFADPDPKVPQDHGGGTNTLALPAGSPAIGAGDSDTCAATGGTNPVSGVDQRGIHRPVTVCDIGAYETPGKALFVIAPTTAIAGTTVTLNVVARDGFGNAMTGYRGTVQVTPSDPASAPFSYGFIATDAGSHTFSSAFPTAGVQTVAVTDTALTAAPATIHVAPVVASLSPNSGDVHGGGTVAIGGTGFGLGSGVQVTFGTGAGSAATILQLTNTTITVRVPAHAAGTVDVSVAVNGVSATKTGAYTYGTAASLPQPPPAGSGSGAPVTLPGSRPVGSSSASGSPHPVPTGR